MNQPSTDNHNGPTFSRTEMWTLTILTALCLLTLGTVAVKRLGWSRDTSALNLSRPQAQPVDINSAPWWELATLPGIGEVRARQIVRMRDLRQGFRSAEELCELRGLGRKAFDRLSCMVTVGAYRKPTPTEDQTTRSEDGP